MSRVLQHPDGTIGLDQRDAGLAISVAPRVGVHVPRREWVTAYPLELIEHVLRVKGPAPALSLAIVKDAGGSPGASAR